MSARRASRSAALGALCGASLALASWACADRAADAASALTGDWDYWRMLGARPSGGFEARRRFGFAHFEGADPAAARLERRAGGTLETVVALAVPGDSLVLDFASGTTLRARVLGDTIAGVLVRDGVPADRVWLVRRGAPPASEPYHPLWPGQVSDSMYPVEIDPAVPMTARDGTTLMGFVARPAGQGPFPVVMERTPYLRVDTANGVFWASRGYLYVKQDVRGRGGSDGILDMNALQEEDGYDAVEWAAALPGSSGKVGMVGRSNPGLYTWYAAIAQPPHLTAIAPVVATADPLRLVPYIDMVFSPTIVPWLCYTAVKETLSDLSSVDLLPAFNHLPVIGSAERAGCPRPQFWDDWFDHQQEDDYWRSLSIERRLDRVQVPVLGIAGWYDDARGNLRNWVGLDTLSGHPYQRVVMDPGAHKGIDYVNGDFGPQARLDHRSLQLRWLARTRFTAFYLHSAGAANTSAGDGTLDTIPPGAEPVDTYTYDPGDPTPYLVDARELERGTPTGTS